MEEQSDANLRFDSINKSIVAPCAADQHCNGSLKEGRRKPNGLLELRRAKR